MNGRHTRHASLAAIGGGLVALSLATSGGEPVNTCNSPTARQRGPADMNANDEH